MRKLLFSALFVVLAVGLGCGGGKGSRTQFDYHLEVTLASGCGDENISASATGVQMLNIQLTPLLGEDVRLERLTVHASGSGDDVVDISTLRLYLDDGDGTYDAGDTELATATFDGDNGRATFNAIVLVPDPAGVILFILADFSGYAGNNCTYTFSIESQSDIVAKKTSDWQTANVKGLPLAGGVKTVTSGGAALVLLEGENNPTDFETVSGHPDVTVMQFTLFVRNSGSVDLTGVTLTASGTGNDSADISSVELLIDGDGDGTLSAGDTSLASGTYAADNGTLSLTFPAYTMPENTKHHFIVVYDFAPAASAGSTYKSEIAAPGDVSASASPVGATPIEGATVTIRDKGELQIAIGANSPSDYETRHSTENNAVLQLSLTALYENITVQSITVTASGTGDDSADVSAVRVFLDENGNGKFDTGETQLGSDALFAADDGTATINTDRTLAEGTTEDWLITLSFNDQGSKGSTYSVSVVADTDVTAVGAYSTQSITPTATFPLDGAVITILYDAFILVGNLNTRRVFHTQTTFYDPNDKRYKVLICGGWDGNDVLDTAEVYDPQTRQFTELTEKMNVPRLGHTATLLPDGRILIAGGYNGANTEKSIEFFDPTTGTFSPSSLVMITPHESHLAAAIDDRVFLAFGYATYFNTPELTSDYDVFDIPQNKRVQTGYIEYLRTLFAYAVTEGETIVVSGGLGYPRAGGGSTTPAVLDTFELWRISPSVIHTKYTVSLLHYPGRLGHRMVALGNNRILILGGYDINPTMPSDYSGPVMCEIYDDGIPTTLGDENISSTGELSEIRYLPIAIRLPDGRVLVAGGSSGDTLSPTVLNTAELFDPTTGEFTLSKGSLNIRRYTATESLLPGLDGVLGTSDDRVLIVGGLLNWSDFFYLPSEDRIHDTAEVYIP